MVLALLVPALFGQECASSLDCPEGTHCSLNGHCLLDDGRLARILRLGNGLEGTGGEHQLIQFGNEQAEPLESLF